MNYRSKADVERLMTLVREHDLSTSVKTLVESALNKCRNTLILPYFQSLSDDVYRSILISLKEHFVSCCTLCLGSPKAKRGLLLKVKFFDTTFLYRLLSESKIDCGSETASGIFVNTIADAFFNECLKYVRTCCDDVPGSADISGDKIIEQNNQPNALLAITGGTLGLCISRLVKMKKIAARKNPQKVPFYQKALNFASLFRMSSKQKLEMLRTESDPHLRFLFYRDRGFLHIPKLQMLPLIHKINGEVRYHFSNDIFSITTSKTLQHIWSGMEEKKVELFNEFVELAVVFAGGTVDQDVAWYFFKLFVSKFCHASMNEHFRNMKISAFDKKGKRCHGGISLREKLYATT